VKSVKKSATARKRLNAVPEGANSGFRLRESDRAGFAQRRRVVLDLGSGAGFDCFFSLRKSRGERQKSSAWI